MIEDVDHPFYLTVGHIRSKKSRPVEVLERQLRDWMQWFNFAKKHRHVALLLVTECARERARWEEDLAECRRRPMSPLVHDQMMMSMGFAVENLAKGALVGTMTEVLTTQGKLRRPLGTHNIPRIVAEAGVPLSADHEEFLQMAKVMVSGPNARYPARSNVGEPTLTSASWTLLRLRERFEEVFELLALALLDRNHAKVEIKLPQYQDDEQCVFGCTNREWLAWELHGEVPPWLPVPSVPTNPWRSQIEAVLAAARDPSEK